MKSLGCLLCTAATMFVAVAPSSLAAAPRMGCVGDGKIAQPVAQPGDPGWPAAVQYCLDQGGHPGPISGH
jgi:hypothetical protein